MCVHVCRESDVGPQLIPVGMVTRLWDWVIRSVTTYKRFQFGATALIRGAMLVAQLGVVA